MNDTEPVINRHVLQLQHNRSLRSVMFSMMSYTLLQLCMSHVLIYRILRLAQDFTPSLG
jgi:hypothetical protein